MYVAVCACLCSPWSQRELGKVVAAVEAKQRICDATAGEKSRLERESETTRARLIRAEKLTKGLVSEGVRWKQEVAVVTEQVGCDCVSVTGWQSAVNRRIDDVHDYLTHSHPVTGLVSSNHCIVSCNTMLSLCVHACVWV